MSDYSDIKYYLKKHEVSNAEAIINDKLPDFAVNLRDYQYVKFYKSVIEIVFDTWALLLKFDNNGNLVERQISLNNRGV